MAGTPERKKSEEEATNILRGKQAWDSKDLFGEEGFRPKKKRIWGENSSVRKGDETTQISRETAETVEGNTAHKKRKKKKEQRTSNWGKNATLQNRREGGGRTCAENKSW